MKETAGKLAQKYDRIILKYQSKEIKPKLNVTKGNI